MLTLLSKENSSQHTNIKPISNQIRTLRFCTRVLMVGGLTNKKKTASGETRAVTQVIHMSLSTCSQATLNYT